MNGEAKGMTHAWGVPFPLIRSSSGVPRWPSPSRTATKEPGLTAWRERVRRMRRTGAEREVSRHDAMTGNDAEIARPLRTAP